MAAGAWTVTDVAKEYLFDGTAPWETSSFKIALFTSATTFAVTSTAYSTTNEVSNAGYTAGGAAITTGAGSITRSGSTSKFTSGTASVAWTASGASLVARTAVLYKTSTNEIIAYMLLDGSNVDVTTTAGNALTITTPANGFFTLA